MAWRDSRSLRVAFCVTIACLLYLPKIGKPALWEPDEGRYAEIAREMLVSGDYITPRDDWVRYFEKPPLVYWVSAASMRLLGRNETAVRLPIAFASIAQIGITQVMADVMFGPAAGICAAICLALSPLFFGFSRFLTLDPVLALFITAALACFYAATRKPALAGGRNWLYLTALWTALGTLTKGPVALVLVLGIGIIYLAVEGRARELAQVPWIGCTAIVLAVGLPWFVLVSWRNPGFLRFFIVHEHIDRYALSTEHLWGPYFFVVVVVAGMWPWICFVPPAIRDWLIARRHGNPGPDAADIDGGLPDAFKSSADSPVAAASALRLAIVWFAFVFVFFTIPRSKLGSYILPAIPAVAILAGYGLSRLSRLDPRRVTLIFGLIAAVDLVVVLAAIVAAPMIRELRQVPALRIDLFFGTGMMAAGAVAAYAIWRRIDRTAPAAVMLALGMTAALGTMVKARGDAAALDSYRNLAHAISRELHPGCVMASYRHHVQALPFYTGWREALVSYRGELAPWGWTPDAAASFIPSDADLRALWKSGSCVILVINRRDFKVLGPQLTPPPRQIGAEGKKLAITNQPASNRSTFHN